MRNLLLTLVCAIPLVALAGDDDIPFTFCGQAKTVVVNGKKLTKAEVKKYENCAGITDTSGPGFVISGYKNRRGAYNFNFVTENNVLTITITDEKGKIVTNW